MERVRGRVYLRLIILSICLLSLAQSARATTVIRPPDDDMIVGARAIITGKVLQIESAIDERQDRIYTYITVRVTEVIKGQISERKIILKEFGGIVGDRVSVVYGNPRFARGEKVLLYLGTHNDGSLRTYQLFLGKFSIVTDEATAKRFAVRDNGGENVSVLTTPGQPQGDSTDRMELSSYIDLVRTKLAVNLARSQAFEDTYFKNVPVLPAPPNFVSSNRQVHPEYAFLGNLRWFQPDSGQPVPYTINPNPGGSGASQLVPDSNDISAAASAWMGVPGCSLTLSYAGNLDTCYTLTGTPGVNFVSNNCDGHNQPSVGCANILAIGGYNGIGSQTRVIGGIPFGQITQGFVSFNPWASCYFSDHCNFREVATHELGHALGLAHPTDPTATMYAFAHFDGRCASIKQDDINGISFLYPGAGGGPGPLTIVTSALSSGSVGSSYSQSLTASGGTTPYGWSVVAGLGSLPSGLNLSAGGTISGTPSTAGTYNFTVKVTDGASAAAQKALSIVVTAAGAAPFDSQFVSQTVPTTLQPGQAFDANVKFLNTGTQAWSGSLFYLASQNPPLNATWGGNSVSLGTFTCNPGQQMEVAFTAFAPTTPGNYNFQWQIYKNDGSGFFGQPTTSVSIAVGDVAPPSNPPSIGGPSSLAAVKGTLFTYTPTATGGTAPYSWQLAAGPLPAGLSFTASTGAIAGTPTVTGNFAVTVQVTDSKSQTAQKALTIAITAATVPPVDITTSTLGAATKGVAFSQQLAATGGKAPYTWAVTSGALPGGLNLAAATGIIAGTPGAAGSFNFNVTATDSESRTATKTFSITVTGPALSIASVPALEGQKGSSLSYQLSASGGTSPYKWLVTSGAFPAGLSLGTDNGLISGVPSVGGLFTFTVTVRDLASVSATANVQISLLDPDTIPAITKVKYKGAKKLIVTGDKINPAAALLVDGNQMAASVSDGSIVVKSIVLAPGRHEIRVANPGGVLSAPYFFTVD
jgi:hypothetical protein